MKPLITVSVAMVFFKLRWPYVDGFDPNVMAHNMGLYFERFFMGIKDTYIATKRSTGYSWYIAETAFKDEDVVWQTKAAEYFYYREYKNRNRKYRRRAKRRALAIQMSNQAANTEVSWYKHPIGWAQKQRRENQARKDTNETTRKFERARLRLFYEFYCSPTMSSKRMDLCRWALLNKALDSRHLVVDNGTVPKCEERRVILDHRRFRTEGTFLRCSYHVQNANNEPTGHKHTAFIKAVKKPAEFRLILYWLEEVPSQDVPVQFVGATASDYPAGADQNYVPPQYGGGVTGGYPNVGQNSIPYPNAAEMTGTSGFPYPQPPANAQKQNQEPSQNYAWYQVVDEQRYKYPQQYPQESVPSQPRTDTQKYNQQQIPSVPHTANTYAFSDPVMQSGSFNNAARTTAAATANAQSFSYGMESIDLQPPALRVVYMLLNKRFSKDPAEKLV